MTDRDVRIEELLARARVEQEPTAEDQKRVHASLMAAIAAGTPPSIERGEPNPDLGPPNAGPGATMAATTGVKGWVVGVLLLAGGAVLMSVRGSGREPNDTNGSTSHADTAVQVLDGAAIPAHPPASEDPLRSPEPNAAEVDPAENATPDVAIQADDAVRKLALDGTHPNAARAATAASQPAHKASKVKSIPVAKTLVGREKTNPSDTAHHQDAAQKYAPDKPTPGRNGELALIRAASQALSQHDGPSAMRLLETHRREYARGVFALEAEGLRVLALCAQGPTAAGKVARERFLADHPQAPLAGRVRDACMTPSRKAP